MAKTPASYEMDPADLYRCGHIFVSEKPAFIESLVCTLQVAWTLMSFFSDTERTHHGKRCKGRTPMTTFAEGKMTFKEKNIAILLAA
jgi:hypothetical protein